MVSDSDGDQAFYCELMGEYITLAEQPHIMDLFVFSQTDFGQGSGKDFPGMLGFWEEPQSLCNVVHAAMGAGAEMLRAWRTQLET